MIVQEYYMTRSDGVRLIRHYSNLHFYMQDNSGNVYTEAIDPESLNREYHEIPISINNEPQGEEQESQEIEEMREALQILFGGYI